ncbi:MAG TPA: DinB family protein [Longimicrobiales bacterium]|nr:DinB family protein [Longimicrobiales bacterium]
MENSHHPVILELRAARDDLRAAWDSVPAAARHRAPVPGAWTPAEVLEHLARTLGQVVRLAEALWAGRSEDLPRAPGGADAPSPASRLDAHRVEDRSERFAAPDFALPDRGQLPEESWDQLAAGWERLVALAASVAGYDTSSLRAPHPFLGVLDLEQWLLFAAKHERRHTAQLREAAEALRR